MKIEPNFVQQDTTMMTRRIIRSQSRHVQKYFKNKCYPENYKCLKINIKGNNYTLISRKKPETTKIHAPSVKIQKQTNICTCTCVCIYV